MALIDLLLLSIKNLWRHRIRTALTVTGVAIGTCAIIIMISLGLAMNKNFLTQLDQMGNLMQIQIYNYNQGGSTADGKKVPDLDDKAIALFEKMEGVEVATPLMDLGMKAVAGKYTAYLQLLGMKPEALEALGIQLSEGELFGEENAKDNVMLIGPYMAQNFYKPNPRRWEPAPADFDLMQEKVSISWDMNYGEKLPSGTPAPKVKAKPIKVRITGKMAETGSQFDYAVLMPIETVKYYKKEQEKFNRQNNGGGGGGGIRFDTGSSTTGYNQALVKVESIDYVEEVYQKIKDMGYEAYSPISYLEDMKKQSAGLQQILGGIGAMALLIAAIGIANTMYMSIYERTREIGIIKVIGAKLGDIRSLFMVEAAWIGIFGGIVGMLFSIGASFLLNNSNLNLGNNMMWMPNGEERLPISYIPIWLAGAAFGFSIAASLIAGFFPSLRAMRLSVMKALRQE